MRFVLATANPDKAEEIRAILAECGLHQIELVPRPAEVAEVIEDGDSLEANARLKSTALVAATGLAAIADDTGLEVDALGGAPGIHAARYAGPDASYSDNVDRLLLELAAVDTADRTARFRTVAIATVTDGSELVASGTVEGVIAAARLGDGGFGYDPVFVPTDGDGRSFSEMGPAAKHAISHRGRAFRALIEMLAARLG
jgi:XTP/dITP diphosphohydrolase